MGGVVCMLYHIVYIISNHVSCIRFYRIMWWTRTHTLSLFSTEEIVEGGGRGWMCWWECRWECKLSSLIPRRGWGEGAELLENDDDDDDYDDWDVCTSVWEREGGICTSCRGKAGYVIMRCDCGKWEVGSWWCSRCLCFVEFSWIETSRECGSGIYISHSLTHSLGRKCHDMIILFKKYNFMTLLRQPALLAQCNIHTVPFHHVSITNNMSCLLCHVMPLHLLWFPNSHSHSVCNSKYLVQRHSWHISISSSRLAVMLSQPSNL